MFRERIVEWSRMMDVVFNAWSEIKISRKISVDTHSSGSALRRVFNMDPSRTEANRDVARTYIRPMDGNR